MARVSTFLCVLALIGADGSARADGPGFQLHSTLPGLNLVTVLSAEGAVTTVDPVGAPGSGPSITVAVRNLDHSAWAADRVAKTVTLTSLADQIATRRTEQAQVNNMRPPLDIAVPKSQATLTTLPDKATLDGFSLTAVSLQSQGQSWRLWYAEDLPSPAPDTLTALGSLIPADAAAKGLSAELARLTLVRAQFKSGSDWKTVFDTQSIARVTARSSDLAPPAGFAPVAPRSKATANPPGGMSVPAFAIRGPGPVMSHPELDAVFWGPTLTASANLGEREQLLTALNDIIKPAYTQALGQYDIHGMKLNGVFNRPGAPLRDVGNADFVAISAMVYDVGFMSGGPTIWWEVGGHDPLYVLLVDDSEVETGSWGGYHFVAPSLTYALLPFPANLFAHDAIPWSISRVAHLAATLPVEAALFRAQCKGNGGVGAPANTCGPLAEIDESTTDIAHEVVEAASDPYVFLGWSDPTHQPFYRESELSDICESKQAPWAETTVVGTSMVATYWSNADHACVPESRPSLKLFEPTSGEVEFAAGGQFVGQAFASDPVDGDISAKIRWMIDGSALKDTNGNPVFGHIVNGAVTPGAHTATVSVTDSRSLSQSVSVSFSAQAHPAQISIVSPPNGATYGSGRPVVLRGAALHLQSGDIPDSSLRWFDGATPLGSGPLVASSLTGVGDHQVSLKVVNPSGVVEGPITVTVHVVVASKIPFAIMITAPATNSFVGVPSPTLSRSAPVTLSAQILGAPPGPAPTITWSSDLQGVLGTGPTISVPLAGGFCTPSTHHITASAPARKSPSPGLRPSDTVTISVGQIC